MPAASLKVTVVLEVVVLRFDVVLLAEGATQPAPELTVLDPQPDITSNAQTSKTGKR